jgi:Ca2+-binding RTX toxin-like protein
MLESLESRKLMTVFMIHGTITIEGTSQRDAFLIDLSASKKSVLVKEGNGDLITSFRRDHVKRLFAELSGGDDVFSLLTTRIPSTIIGGSGDDGIVTDSSHSVISGGDGDDTINVQAPYSIVSGGAGNDGISILPEHAGSDDLPTPSNARAFLFYGGLGDDTLVNNDAHAIAKLMGNEGNDHLYSAGAGDTLEGGVGNDRIEGRSANHVLRGGAGDDTILWSDGDSVFGGPGDDRIIHIVQ